MLFTEVREFADDLRRVFEELERRQGAVGCVAGEYRPALDVSATADAFQIVVDLPGVPVDGVRVIIKHDVVLIAGAKGPIEGCGAPDHASFHLVERGFGRFARGVRVPGAFDASRARASLQAGELRVTLPRLAERRGRPIIVPIER